MKKLWVTVCLLAVLSLVGASFALAADTKEAERPERGGRPVLTEEQKAEFKEKMAERKEKIDAANGKWSALTDAQKEEIYALKEQAAYAEGQIIDKYLEWGLIDSDTAAKMKERFSKLGETLRESGKMPMPGGHGGKMPRKSAPETTE